eukprot:11424655-Alexandrium_andersonii.AAC.1
MPLLRDASAPARTTRAPGWSKSSGIEQSAKNGAHASVGTSWSSVCSSCCVMANSRRRHTHVPNALCSADVLVVH